VNVALGLQGLKRLSVVARLLLVLLIPFGAASVTELSPLRGVAHAVSVDAIPRKIAQALGLASPSPPVHTVTPVTPTVPVRPAPVTPVVPPSTPKVVVNQPPPPTPVKLATYKLSAPNVFNVGASGLVPGSVVSREVVVENVGTGTFSTISVEADAQGSSPLVTDATQGFQLSVSECPVAWVASSLADGGIAYSCPQAPSTILTTPLATILGEQVPLRVPSSALAPGGYAYLVFSLTLPSSDGTSIEGQVAQIQWSFYAEAS